MATGDIKQVTNNSASNYCKMPDGTLICWGKCTIPTNQGNGTITLPVSFINTEYGVGCVPDISTSTAGTYSSGLFSAQRISTNQIRFHRSVGMAQYDNYIYFVAVGRWK